MFGEDESGSRQLSPDIQTRFPVPGQESAKKDKMMLVISGAGPVAQPMNYQAAGLPTFQLAPGFSSSTLNPLPIPHHSPGNVLHLHSRPTQPLTVVSALPLFTQASTSPQRQLPLAAGSSTVIVPAPLTAPSSFARVSPVKGTPRAHMQLDSPPMMVHRLVPTSAPPPAGWAQRPDSLDVPESRDSGRSSSSTLCVIPFSSSSPSVSPATSAALSDQGYGLRYRPVYTALSSTASREGSPAGLSTQEVGAMPRLISGLSNDCLEVDTPEAILAATAAAAGQESSSDSADSSSQSSQSATSSVSCQPADAGEMMDLSMDEVGEPLLLSPETMETVTESSTAKQVFTKMATRVLRDWVCRNIHYPYATKVVKRKLAREAILSTQQVSSWLTNSRRRLIPKLIEHENKLRMKRGLPPLTVTRRKRRTAH